MSIRFYTYYWQGYLVAMFLKECATRLVAIGAVYQFNILIHRQSFVGFLYRE